MANKNGGKALGIFTVEGNSKISLESSRIPKLIYFYNLLEKDLRDDKQLSQDFINNLDGFLNWMDFGKMVFEEEYEFLTTKENFREIEESYLCVKKQEANGSVNIHLDKEDAKILVYGFCDLSKRVLEKYSQDNLKGEGR